MNTDPPSIRRRAALPIVALLTALAAFDAVAADMKPATIKAAVAAAYERYRGLQEGKNADYIPALANVDPSIYGIALVTPDGNLYTAGDVTTEVSIQSISKVFTLAKVIE
ncbi:MAG TPA: glutaminase, partial [Pseudomonadales bacterium]|nr:glutaminase [Pseudomonadales bacterium]